MSASMSFGAHGARSPSFGVLSFVGKMFARSLSRAGAAQQRMAKLIREANDVRALAASVESHSPSFAADLYAAAARHENRAR